MFVCDGSYATMRNNPVNLQYEPFFNLRENFMFTLHDFTCMLVSLTVLDVELTLQDLETYGNSLNLTAFSY